MQKILSLLLVLVFLAGSSYNAHGQENLPTTDLTLPAHDCSLYFQEPIQLPDPKGDETQGDVPHLMPPHPDIQDCIDRGEVAPPQILTDSEYKSLAGIDQPQEMASASFFRTLAILVKFTDNPSQVNPTSFDSLLFGFSNGSLPDYYEKASYGILDIVTVNLPSSMGWYSMPQTYNYYVYPNYRDPSQGIDGGYGIYGPFPRNSQKLAADAARAANSLVDYANYDNNNDGKVDTIFIVHAGRGAEFTGSSSDIWSHSWVTNPADRPVLDGKQIYSYTTEPEYWSSPGDMTVGVFAHELGHVLGLPDLYDTDYSSRGIGRWSLMATGSWNGPGNMGSSPAFPDAWSRVQLGWVIPTAINSHTFGLSIPNSTSNPQILKLKPTNGISNEYFLVENRQKTSYDAYLPNSGLLVWHVDDNKNTNTAECLSLNRWTCQNAHFRVALEQADGLLNLEYKVNSGDTGDSFPGSANRRSYSFSTTPNNSSYFTNSNPLREISNISSSSSVMTADFYIGAYDHSFSKSAPANSVNNLPSNPTLSWGSSLGAFKYEYCIDDTEGSTCTSSWIDNAANLSAIQNNLVVGKTYYWQVRSVHAHGTTDANNGVWWSFTVQSQQPATLSTFLPILIR